MDLALLKIAIIPIVATSLAYGQVSHIGKAYQFRVRFPLKQRISYEISQRLVSSPTRIAPFNVDLTCKEIKKGFFNLQIADRNQDLADPYDKTLWVSDRGRSSHKYAFWFTPCPYGPVRVKSSWRNNPPPFAKVLGASPATSFNYRFVGFEQRHGRKAVRIALDGYQPSTPKIAESFQFGGALLLEASNGMILDETLTCTERHLDAHQNYGRPVTTVIRIQQITTGS